MAVENKRKTTGFKYGGPKRSPLVKGRITAAFDNTDTTLPETMATYNNAIDRDMKEGISGLMNRLQIEEQVKPVTRAEGLGVTNYEGDSWTQVTASLLKDKEDFRSDVYLDKSLSGTKDAYRTGYGSDTITRGNKIITVEQGMTVTKEEAEADLNRRIITEFGPRAKRASGDAWDTWGDNSKAAITSITYNAGNVPKAIKDAIATGDNNKIYQAIINNGKGTILAKRRQAEAELFLLPDASKESIIKRRNK